MLRAALQFLQSLHDAQGWHGAAQLRNLTCLQDGFGAIDFEDDLEPAMPLELRQARDIYLFLISAARYADRDATLVPQLLEDALGRASAPRRGGAEHRSAPSWCRPSACSDGSRHTSAATARPCRPSHVHSGDDRPSPFPMRVVAGTILRIVTVCGGLVR